MKYYEATEGEKLLADAGRRMMDASEYADCRGMKEEGFRRLNNMSHVGHMMTTVGTAFGAKYENFSDEDKILIAEFLKKEVDTATEGVILVK
ncbi:MAG: hypothetical protein ACKVJK_20140 [Methylophagaceae bacterium]|jgi:hypothetical protein|tara:strand:+ start:331 stop:606 length:276 start_codon:yes stop_codon:yes gene_type:complete